MTVKEDLEARIRQANKEYWQENNPSISDSEYDRLVEQLRKLDPKNPVLNEIGKPKYTGEEKVKLWHPHLSLGKTYNRDQLIDWAKKVSRSPDEKLMVSPKYDGVTIVQQGDMVVGRGDGYVGQNITHQSHHISYVSNIAWNNKSDRFDIDKFGLVGILDHAAEDEEMTGELVITEERFARLKEEFPDVFKDYKNCRNFIAGFANSKKDSRIYDLKNKKGYFVTIGDFVAHRAYEVEIAAKDLENPQTLQKLERTLRDFQGYPTDGLVFRLKDEKYAESLGVTAHHPRGAIALKWSAHQLSGVIDHIEWEVGQERVTPTAVLSEPLQFPGHMVQRATLHCAKWVEEHHACKGSKIVVEYAGGVIPKVVDVTYDDSLKLDIPQSCPACGGKLEWDNRYLICTEKHCTGKIANRILKGLDVFGIKGIGPALINKVVSELYVDSIMMFFREFGSRHPYNVDFLRKKGFTNHEILLLTRIEEVQALGATPVQMLMSVCIPKCGREFCETIERKCGGILNLINMSYADGMRDKIVNVCHLDAVTEFTRWMDENFEEFLDYVQMFKLITQDEVDESKLRGIVCFTGSGPRPRHELQQWAKEHNWSVSDTVGRCTVLVCEDPNGNSSKLKKARERGIKIISYHEFLKSV